VLPPEKISLAEVLAQPEGDKRFLELEIKEQNEGQAPASKNETLEITIQPRNFDGKDCQLVVVQNVSYVLKHQKLLNEFEYV